MKIKSLTLYSADLAKQKQFYSKLLDTSIESKAEDQFSVQIGWTKLTFKKTLDQRKYHYCFLIPSNLLNQAIEWISARFNLIQSDDGTVHRQVDWNADSIYFLDGNDNIAEIIVRFDIKSNHGSEFSPASLLCIHEIGAPTTDIPKLNAQFESYLDTKFWKGNYTRFGTNGDLDGIFLMVNTEVKKEWYPTNIATHSLPFEASIESNGTVKNLSFKNGEILKIK